MSKIKIYPKPICSVCFKSIDFNDIGYESYFPYHIIVCEECVESEREDHDDEQSDGDLS